MTDCSDGDVRLVEGFSDYEGYTEVCFDGVYRRVCGNDRWFVQDASVVCRQLGPFSGTVVMPSITSN